jgi:tetratricopeptide (TPR) repeat protein
MNTKWLRNVCVTIAAVMALGYPVAAQGISGRVLPAPGESQLPNDITVTLELPMEAFEETASLNPEGKFFFSVSAGSFVDAYLTVRSPGYQIKRIHITGDDRMPGSLLLTLGPRLPSDSAPKGNPTVVDAVTLESVPEKARKEFEKATEASRKGDSEGALKHLDAALKIHPAFSAAWVAKGVALMKARKPDEAETCLKKAVELTPNDFTANKDLGYLYLSSRREKEAIEPLKVAAAAAPEDSATLAFLGEALYQTGNYEEAAAPLQKAVEVAPDFFRASYRLGYVYVQLKRYDEALAAFELFLKSNKGMDDTQVKKLVEQLQAQQK